MTRPSPLSSSAPVRSGWRWPAAVTLLVVAGVHIPLIGEHLSEAPYVGALFIALSVVSIGLALVLLVADLPAVWLSIAVVVILAIVAFVLSRTVGLPQIGDDVDNWTEPLGFPALASEVLTALFALVVLARDVPILGVGVARAPRGDRQE